MHDPRYLKDNVMAIPVTLIMKVIYYGIAAAETGDKAYTQVKRWYKARKADRARKKRLLEEIKKS